MPPEKGYISMQQNNQPFGGNKALLVLTLIVGIVIFIVVTLRISHHEERINGTDKNLETTLQN
jgi:hypothetical protein